MIDKSCLTNRNTKTKTLIIDPPWQSILHVCPDSFSTLRKDSGPVKLWNAEGSGVALPGGLQLDSQPRKDMLMLHVQPFQPNITVTYIIWVVI